MACAMTIRLRMYWALSGTSIFSAFSTVRTEAMACTVVHTPQKRWVKNQASRGSRPSRIVSIPRNIWPEDQAFCTLPPSTSTSMRRCPSMRVTGSTVMRVAMGPLSLVHGRALRHAGQDREHLHDDDVREDFERHETDGHEGLGDAREVGEIRSGVEREKERVEPVEAAGRYQESRGAEEVRPVQPLAFRAQQKNRSDEE